MLMTLFVVSCFLSGTLTYDIDEVCYGTQYRLPSQIASGLGSHGKLYFTPSSGKTKQLIGAEGQLMDARFSMSHGSVSLRDVTYRDDGTFGAAFFDREVFRTRLKVKDCAKRTETDYMGSFHHSPVDLEYVEFSPVMDKTQVRVLWNRNNPNSYSERVHIDANGWEIRELTPSDEGFYNFRRQDHSLISRMKLVVNVPSRYYTVNVGEELVIEYPSRDFGSNIWTVTVSYGRKEQTLMNRGEWVIDNMAYVQTHDFKGRLRADHSKLTIAPVEKMDRGTFAFKDKTGHKIFTVGLVVKDDPPVDFKYAALAPIPIFLVWLCLCSWCLVKKYRSKKGAGKISTVAVPTVAAPAVYYHGPTQSSGPTQSAHSYSATPAVTPTYRRVIGGEAPSHDAPNYNPVIVHENPLHSPPAPQDTTLPLSHTPPALSPQSTAPTRSLSAVPDHRSTDTELRFELKGMTVPSTPQPLGSDPPTSDVYTSNKLNFL